MAVRHKQEWPVDAFVMLSHLAIALVAAFAFETVAHLPLPLRIVMISAYMILAGFVYLRVKSSATKRMATDAAETESLLREELGEWKRFELLQRHTLSIVAEFLKDRYQVIHGLVSELERLRGTSEFSAHTLTNALEEFDKERRVHIKRALAQLSSFWTEDDYLKPTTPALATKDFFKATFYAVEKLDNNGEPSETGTEYLVKKHRAIPNEGEPRTLRFRIGEGASGKAWETKRIVVCERGGEDKAFKQMWDEQQRAYKSMICIPAIEDIPSERMSDVYGVLSVDTPVREGYFSAELEQFWATLHQPVCNLLIYCRESERLKTAFVNVIHELSPETPLHDEKLRPDASGPANPANRNDAVG
jgi:hypothetical protein